MTAAARIPGKRADRRQRSAAAAVEALSYSAIQLFNERAAAAIGGFVLSDPDVPNGAGNLPRF